MEVSAIWRVVLFVVVFFFPMSFRIFVHSSIRTVWVTVGLSLMSRFVRRVLVSGPSTPAIGRYSPSDMTGSWPALFHFT